MDCPEGIALGPDGTLYVVSFLARVRVRVGVRVRVRAKVRAWGIRHTLRGQLVG